MSASRNTPSSTSQRHPVGPEAARSAIAFSSMRKPITCVIAFLRLTMMNRLTKRAPSPAAVPGGWAGD